MSANNGVQLFNSAKEAFTKNSRRALYGSVAALTLFTSPSRAESGYCDYETPAHKAVHLNLPDRVAVGVAWADLDYRNQTICLRIEPIAGSQESITVKHPCFNMNSSFKETARFNITNPPKHPGTYPLEITKDEMIGFYNQTNPCLNPDPVSAPTSAPTPAPSPA